jgi:hypothetical protein
MEKELFVRLALCVDPRKIGATGLSKWAVRSFGVDAPGISTEERRHREALRDRIREEIKPYSSEAEDHALPGLGAHPGFAAEQLRQIQIPAEMVHAVAKKSFAGLNTGLQTVGSLNRPMNSTFISCGKHLQMYSRPLPLPILSTWVLVSECAEQMLLTIRES